MAVVLFASFAAPYAEASSASLFFTTPQMDVGIEDEFSLSLMLNTDNQIINTIAGDILFSDTTIEPIRIMTGNSIVSSWIQPPFISGNSVTFSGIMPGGYESTTNLLSNEKQDGLVFTIVFRGKQPGLATVSFAESNLYLNDGLGTEVEHSTLPFSTTITKNSNGIRSELNDTVPPESFVPVVSSSVDLFDGAKALFFSTTDKGSGVDYYEISEGFGAWKRASSPYRINDQSLHRLIRVKAVDVAGNYRIETVPGSGSQTATLGLIPIALVVILLLWIFVVYKKRMKKFKTANE